MDCKNYIRILHKMDDDKMYVCGTNAFFPECDYMVRQPELTPFLSSFPKPYACCTVVAFTLVYLSAQSYTNGQLTLEKKDDDGRGKCPYNPFQRYASIMFGEN